MSIINKKATVMVPVEIPIVETKCNKCDKIICRRTDPHEHRDLYEDGILVHQHSCITHPHQLNDDPEIHLCEECFQMFMDNWLNPPDAVPPVPEAPTPPDNPCDGCTGTLNYPNWKRPDHNKWKSLGKDCTTCAHMGPK